VNYSSIRAGLVEFRRQIDAVQWQLFIPMFCAPTWRWFTEAAWAAGQIPSPDVPVEWSPPKFEAVDPQKDAMANLLSIRSGTMTLAEVIARQGRNPDAVLAEIAGDQRQARCLGLVLDSDPRRDHQDRQRADPMTRPAIRRMHRPTTSPPPTRTPTRRRPSPTTGLTNMDTMIEIRPCAGWRSLRRTQPIPTPAPSR
jgi:capsid protein